MLDDSKPSDARAQSRVLDTAELLELILQFLDPITLFAIQRVCKRWKGFIADSHLLQEHMFLRVQAYNEDFQTNCRPSAPRSTSAVLINRSAGRHCYDDNYADIDDDNMEPSPVTLCPILTPATQFIRTHSNQLAVTCSQTALYGRPSWHNMFLTFPACKSATAALWWRLGESMRGSVYLESLAPADSGGLRFSDVVEAALAQKTGKWKRLPDGKLLPLSAAGRDVSLGSLLGEVSGGTDMSVEVTSVLVLTF